MQRTDAAVQRVRAAAGENEQQEGETEQHGRFAIVLHREEPAGQCWVKNATAIVPEATNAAGRVSSPSVTREPVTNSMQPAYHSSDSPAGTAGRSANQTVSTFHGKGTASQRSREQAQHSGRVPVESGVQVCHSASLLLVGQAEAVLATPALAAAEEREPTQHPAALGHQPKCERLDDGRHRGGDKACAMGVVDPLSILAHGPQLKYQVDHELARNDEHSRTEDRDLIRRDEDGQSANAVRPYSGWTVSMALIGNMTMPSRPYSGSPTIARYHHCVCRNPPNQRRR